MVHQYTISSNVYPDLFFRLLAINDTYGNDTIDLLRDRSPYLGLKMSSAPLLLLPSSSIVTIVCLVLGLLVVSVRGKRNVDLLTI